MKTQETAVHGIGGKVSVVIGALGHFAFMLKKMQRIKTNKQESYLIAVN